MKRFKVVQDALGNWGVLDTADGKTFAEWERDPDLGSLWSDALRSGIELNSGDVDIDDFWWSTYRDR